MVSPWSDYELACLVVWTSQTAGLPTLSTLPYLLGVVSTPAGSLPFPPAPFLMYLPTPKAHSSILCSNTIQIMKPMQFIHPSCLHSCYLQLFQTYQ